VLLGCRIYAVVAAGVLSAGLLAPESASAALTQGSEQQRRALLFAPRSDFDGNEGNEGNEGDEVWNLLLPPCHHHLCTTCASGHVCMLCVCITVYVP
jgi:hypothetical protein